MSLRQTARQGEDPFGASAAAERNKQPILETVRPWLPDTGIVLEIASGTGQHVAHFAQELPQLMWQPTDADADRLPAIRHNTTGLGNVLEPRLLDVCSPRWGIPRADAVIAINMIHIAPPAATMGLLSGAAGILAAGRLLVLYGPFRRNGQHTAESNAAFDAELRSRNPTWGVRNLDEVAGLAAVFGFTMLDVCDMPANNLTVAFRKS